MAQVAPKAKHKRSSTLTEMFKLAGDMVGDVMEDMIGKQQEYRHHHHRQYEEEESLDATTYTKRRWDDESSEGTGGTGGINGLRKEFKSQSYHEDDDSFTTTASEELRQDRVRQIRQREMENYRRQREVGDDRELELKQKLSQFEEEFLTESPSGHQEADPDFVFHGPTEAMEKTKSKKKTTNIFEIVQQRAMLALSGGEEEESDEEESLFTEEGETTVTGEEEEDEEDDFADQIVHEMMQLLHHSRKNRNEAERLIGYKRTFVRERHETNPELDAHILKNANYKKLECSARRFVRHIKDGDVPRTEQTLGMERELLANVAVMRDIRRESDELDMEFESMFDAAE